MDHFEETVKMGLRGRSESIRPRKGGPSITRSLSTPFMELGVDGGVNVRAPRGKVAKVKRKSVRHSDRNDRNDNFTDDGVEEMKMAVEDEEEEKDGDEILSDELVRTLHLHFVTVLTVFYMFCVFLLEGIGERSSECAF